MNKELINWDQDKNKQLLKDVCKTQGLNDEEFRLFLFVCKERGLNPLLGHIYAIKRQNKMTIQIGIDGYRSLADRTGRYMPGKAPEYKYEGDKLGSATAYVKKLKDGDWHEVSAQAFYDEYCVQYNGKPSGSWAKMPHVMLAKCAESAALRKAFASELSGVYTQEEMNQAEVVNEDEIKVEAVPEDHADINDKISKLHVALEEASIDSSRVMEYLEEMAGKKDLSLYDMACSALGSIDVFVPHYEKWITPKEEE